GAREAEARSEHEEDAGAHAGEAPGDEEGAEFAGVVELERDHLTGGQEGGGEGEFVAAEVTEDQGSGGEHAAKGDGESGAQHAEGRAPARGAAQKQEGEKGEGEEPESAEGSARRNPLEAGLREDGGGEFGIAAAGDELAAGVAAHDPIADDDGGVADARSDEREAGAGADGGLAEAEGDGDGLVGIRARG